MQQLTAIPVADNLLEQQAHGSFGFPLAVYLDDLDAYDLGHVPWHWHPELEFGVMLKGEAEVQVADNRFTLRQGEGFFINANVLHAQHPLRPGSMFFSVVFSPRLLAGHMGSTVGARFVTPVLECAAMKSLRLRPTVLWQKEVLAHLQTLRRNCGGPHPNELAATATLLQLWQALYFGCASFLDEPQGPAARDEQRIKLMLDYIHSHYPEAIFLDDIAAAASLSASECCRCFQRVLGTTPFGYLNQHRLVQAAALLRQGHSATQVYAQTGHCSQSYFGKQFKALFGCTPGQYRRASLSHF